MKFNLILEDEYGNQVNMTKNASGGYMTSEITGLDPPTATVVTSTYATGNLSHYDNSYVPKRNIVIKFEMRGPNVEKRRQELYEVVRPASYIKVYYKTKRRNVYSEGYVETCTISNFSEKVSGQISIVCPDPYWYELESTVITHNFGDVIDSTDNFRFEAPNDEQPFVLGRCYDETYTNAHGNKVDKMYVSICNGGEEVGFSCAMTWEGAYVSSPNDSATLCRGLTIANDSAGTTFNMLDSTAGRCVIAGWDFELNTNLGQCSVISRDTTGVYDNVFNIMRSVSPSSEWIQLVRGENIIVLDNLPLLYGLHATPTFDFRTRYLGV